MMPFYKINLNLVNNSAYQDILLSFKLIHCSQPSTLTGQLRIYTVTASWCLYSLLCKVTSWPNKGQSDDVTSSLVPVSIASVSQCNLSFSIFF